MKCKLCKKEADAGLMRGFEWFICEDCFMWIRKFRVIKEKKG